MRILVLLARMLGCSFPSIWGAVRHRFRFIQLLRLRLPLGLMPRVLWPRLLLPFLQGGIIMGLRSRLSNMVGLLVLYLFALSLLINKVLRGSGPGVPDWITICQFLRILVSSQYSILRFSLKGLEEERRMLPHLDIRKPGRSTAISLREYQAFFVLMRLR